MYINVNARKQNSIGMRYREDQRNNRKHVKTHHMSTKTQISETCINGHGVNQDMHLVIM